MNDQLLPRVISPGFTGSKRQDRLDEAVAYGSSVNKGIDAAMSESYDRPRTPVRHASLTDSRVSRLSCEMYAASDMGTNRPLSRRKDKLEVRWLFQPSAWWRKSQSLMAEDSGVNFARQASEPDSEW